MSQKSSSERSPLRAVSGERNATSHLTDSNGDNPPEGATVQHIWDIVRKSTDVIVALREENAILRNELSVLRKGESVLQERLQDLLSRIDQLESVKRSNDSKPTLAVHSPSDKVEDSFQRSGGNGSRGCRTTTITITMQDDTRSDLENRVSGLVHSLVEEIKRGI